MIITHVERNLKDLRTLKAIEVLVFEYYEASKHQLRKTTSKGEVIGIRVATPLKDGDILYEDESRIIAAVLKPTEVIEVKGKDFRTLAMAAYEMGNRHLPVMIMEGVVITVYDEVQWAFLKGKGFEVQKMKRKFVGMNDGSAHEHVH
jgi:urease accessory protein